jgi:hypothetical protein
MPALDLIFQQVQISRDIPAAQLLHVAVNSLFHPLPDPAIAVPAVPQVLQEDSKLSIVHGFDLKGGAMFLKPKIVSGSMDTKKAAKFQCATCREDGPTLKAEPGSG